MFELVNTSLPNGLLPGTHGFATVAMTRGLADNLRRRLEDLSAYVHKVSAHDATYDTLNPVAWSHLILPRGEHVLGRVAAAPFDYTGRTNRLARLVCLATAEAKSFNAAETLLRENAYFSAPWEGEARWLEPDAALTARFGAASARASRKSQAWIDAFGETDGSRYAASFAALLRDSIRQNSKPLVFVTSQQSDPDGRRALAFIADLIALLPEDLQPSATFSTYPCAIPIGVKCAIRVLRKDDNGYAQAVAGVPVADFAAKAVQNANLLPHDAELEHLAATGNLPAPSALTTPTKAVSQAAELTPTAASTATDGAIDVSIDIPPATESDEAIAVTEKDASHRKPKLKQRSGRSATMPMQGQRFDPLFGQPHKQSNGPLIAAVVGGTILLLCLAAFVVRQSKPQYSSSKEHSVQNAQAETKKEEELRRKQEEQERQEEKKRKADAAAKAKAEQQAKQDRLDREAEAKAAIPTVKDTAKPGKVDPLNPNVTNIVLCANDAKVKEQFGRQRYMCKGSVWYYCDGADKMILDKPFGDTEKDWETDDMYGGYKPRPNGLPMEKSTPYCRIWHFAKKPDTLYWVTNKADRAEFELDPPHNNTPVNLAERLTGPDLRVFSQWTISRNFGCQAWTADSTAPVDLREVNDPSSFSPSDFIAQSYVKRKEALDKEYAEVQAKQSRLKELHNETNTLTTAISDIEKKIPTLTTLSNIVVNAWSDYMQASKTYQEIDNECDRIDRELAAAREKRNSRIASIDLVYRSKNSKERGVLDKEKEALESTVTTLEKSKGIKDEEKKQAHAIMGDLKEPYYNAKSKYDERKKEIDRKKSELDKRVAEIEDILAKDKKVKADQATFPRSVEEAQKQWAIHVKVNLGGAK